MMIMIVWCDHHSLTMMGMMMMTMMMMMVMMLAVMVTLSIHLFCIQAVVDNLCFLPDPGVSGVRSMGPGVPPSKNFVKLC